MKIKLIIVSILALFTFIACGQKETQNNTGSVPEVKIDKIRVAYHPNMGGASAIITGIENGYFAEQNLEIELVKFTSGPPEIAAMLSGDIQIGYIGFGAHTLAAEGNVQIIATDGIAIPEGIRTLKSSGINTVEKLIGKTLVTQLGTSGEATIDQVLNGTSVKKTDIKILNTEIASAVAAFVAGRADAIAVWPPYTIEIEKRLGIDNITVIKPGELGVDPTASWVVTPKYLEASRDIVVRFVRAIYASMDARENDIDASAALVAELVGVDLDTVLQERYSSNWMYSQRMKDLIANGEIETIYKRQTEYFVENNRLQKDPVPVEQYFRLDVIKEALN